MTAELRTNPLPGTSREKFRTALLTIDRRLHALAVLPTWFYRLRRNATAIVISMLLLVALAWWVSAPVEGFLAVYAVSSAVF